MLSRIAPRVVFATGVLSLVSLLTAATVLVAQGRSDCADRVATRDDQRSMWLYALEQNPDNPRAPAFRAELDRRIPPLTCKGWLGTHPDPIGD